MVYDFIPRAYPGIFTTMDRLNLPQVIQSESGTNSVFHKVILPMTALPICLHQPFHEYWSHVHRWNTYNLALLRLCPAPKTSRNNAGLVSMIGRPARAKRPLLAGERRRQGSAETFGGPRRPFMLARTSFLVCMVSLDKPMIATS